MLSRATMPSLEQDRPRRLGLLLSVSRAVFGARALFITRENVLALGAKLFGPEGIRTIRKTYTDWAFLLLAKATSLAQGAR